MVRGHEHDVGDTWTLPVPRLLVERFSGRFWAWLDREEFLVPKNVLDIVAGQTVTWMGLFYCPLLPLLNSVFIFLTFYIKKVRARWLRGSRGHLGGTLSGAHGLPALQCRFPGPQTPGLLPTGADGPRVACSAVHPPEELQGVPSEVPSLQLHFLLPAGAHPGPAPGHRAPGLRGQQVRGAEAQEAAGWASVSSLGP